MGFRKTDYYPFGMMMPARKYSSESYRYGFNGKEKDKDINSLTAYDYGFRIYNPGIGRFLSVDPLTGKYPWYTPYQFAGNDVIANIDLDGGEPSLLHECSKLGFFFAARVSKISISQAMSSRLTAGDSPSISIEVVNCTMPVKGKITESEGIYFITFTCFQWLPLIEQTKSYDLVYNWFDHLRSKGHYINGYVIMPNHVHALIAFRNTDQFINTIIGNGKRFIAYEIVNRLKLMKQIEILEKMEEAVETKDRERNKHHEVWEDSFDWKDCRTFDFIKQKLVYMHNNPCSGKWNLAATPADYEHSSARFYLCGEHAAYAVTSYMELEDIDLTKTM